MNTTERNGVLVVDKPAGMTSHDVVARVRRLLREKSVGHLGTLDPMATGVLPLVVGRMTRIAQFYGDSQKDYEGEIRFGYSTTTYDADGERVEDAAYKDSAELTLEQVRAEAARLVGKISQVPPSYSAKKLNGVPAYKLARKQSPVELKAVEVIVDSFEIGTLADSVSRFNVSVSAGTYVRSLAHEMGLRLGCGAHLSSLRRTRAGEFTLEEAHTMADLESNAESPEELFIHPRRVLSKIPAVTATGETVSYIRNGRAVNLPEMSDAPFVKVYMSQRQLLAVCQRIAGTLFRPKVVLYGSNEALPVE
jgi:tRNA pseudouridine55 synthase